MYSNKREYSKFVICFLRSRNQNRILLLLRAIEQNTKGGIIVKKNIQTLIDKRDIVILSVLFFVAMLSKYMSCQVVQPKTSQILDVY